MQGKETFEAAGGERYTLIPCLNAQQSWVDSLARWCLDAEPRHKRSASEGS
jgi:ferrochelatase